MPTKTGSGCLLLIVFLSVALKSGAQAYDCKGVFGEQKKLHEIGCKCYDSIAELICNEPDGLPKNITPLAVVKPPRLNKITILKGKNFATYAEHLGLKTNLKATSLEIESAFDGDAETLASLEEIGLKKFQLTILPNLTDTTGNKKTTINVSVLPKSLEWLSITNAELVDLNLNDMKNLTVLELVDVILPNQTVTVFQDNYVIHMTKLERLKLNRVANLRKTVTVMGPATCKTTDARIYIDLRQNSDMKGFDFSNLNLDECKYHIDLSENEKQFPDLLSSYVPEWKNVTKLSHKGKDQIYLIMQDTLQTCTTCLYKFVMRFSDFIHSIQCLTIEGITGNPYLKELDDAQQKVLATKTGSCEEPTPKPTTPTPKPTTPTPAPTQPAPPEKTAKQA